jgi:hypothetical protein
MKYFTRELIEQGRSPEDAVLTQHEETWDAVCELYFNHLDALKEEMPLGLRKMVDSYYLHDAVVHGMGQTPTAFMIFLQLDTPPQSLLTFTYDLVRPPKLDREGPAAGGPSREGQIEWEHDEIGRSEVDPSAWQQSILLSNGWEVTLHFRDVVIQEAAALIPAPMPGITNTPQPASPQTV